MFKHKNALAVTSEGCFLCCAVYFRSSSGLDVQNLLWMGRRRACLVLSTHFQQLVYFIFLCQSYCRLFSVDSCTAVWTTIGNVVAAVGKGILFEAVVTGIAVVKFQFLITSVLLRACNVCGYCYVIGTHIKPCFSLNSRTSAAFTSSNRGRSSSSGSSSGLIFPRTLPTIFTWSSSDFSP